MDATDLVTKLLAEGAKEFPHQWMGDPISCLKRCSLCLALGGNDNECPVLLRAALDLTLKERDALQEELDETIYTLQAVQRNHQYLDGELERTQQQLAEALDPTVREE